MQQDVEYAVDGPGALRPAVSRASMACARCRKQKLKCDSMKPCTMCVRSGMECRPRGLRGSAGRKQRKQTTNAVESVGPGTGKDPTHRGPVLPTSPMIEEHPSSELVQVDAPGALSRHLRTESSPHDQQFGANRSAMSLAMNMYESLGTSAPLKASTIPGDATPNYPQGPLWTLQFMEMPPLPIMEALIDAYFKKVDWFIWIFHKPSFILQARQILSTTSWRRADMSKILAVLTVAALGLKCAMQDSSPQGQNLLESTPGEPRKLLDQMIGEVQLHLIELLDDSCIETVQVCVLLGAFHIFHGSPSLAWANIGLSVRASYALALHCDSETDPITTQVRRRCWNHLTVADTFASQIYGRPASLDSAFSDLLPLTEIDDTVIDISAEHYVRNKFGDSVSGMTFHWLKYRLYEIIRRILSTFRLMRLHKPMTAEELQTLIVAVQDLDRQLDEWRSTLPESLNSDNLPASYLQQTPPQEWEQNSVELHGLRQLKLQAYVLQITYDAAVILAHRPLLEHKLSLQSRQDTSKSSFEYVSRSFDVSVKASLRISRVPIMEFKNEFCMAFIFIHLFSAGVILCILPTSHPYSNTAQEAKAGVFRIIQAAKALRSESQIARHTERLLSDLLKLSLHREVDMAFKEERQSLTQNEHPSQEYERRPTSTNTFDGQTENQVDNSDYVEALLPGLPTPQTDGSAMTRDADINNGTINDEWLLPPSFQSNDNFDFQPMDLPLDEAFGAFGQVMFNLLPDDPLNIWGWGKGFM